MKPTKNSIYCPDARKTKMQFETEKKALNFIKFNGAEIRAENGYSPRRAYYCIACNAYHVTSKPDSPAFKKREQVLEDYLNSVKVEKERKEAAEKARLEAKEARKVKRIKRIIKGY